MVRPIRVRLVREDDKTTVMDQVEGDSNGWRLFQTTQDAIDYYTAHDPAKRLPDHTSVERRTKFANLKNSSISNALSNGGITKKGAKKRTGSYTDGNGA